MIREIRSDKDRPGFTSDRWHVVRATWSGEVDGEAQFERAIVSEHVDRASAIEAARRLLTEARAEDAGRDPDECDQVFVRRPAFRTLKVAGRVDRRPRRR
jgi:hypothetical protein